MTSFKPCQVMLHTPPLTACFNKTEAECAAAILVWVCQQLGNEWQRLSVPSIDKALDAAMSASPMPEPICSWVRNPFISPDFARLVVDGFIERSEIDGEEGYVFTPAFFERVARWVVPMEAQS